VAVTKTGEVGRLEKIAVSFAIQRTICGEQMKKVFLILTVVIGLGLVIGGIILVPPHLQIRKVEPALPSLAEVQQLLSVDNKPVRISAMQNSTKPVAVGVGGNAVFVIEWDDGRMFMVDAGMDKDAAIAFAKQTALLGGAGPLEYRMPVDQALGERIKNVDGVGFTHLHIDHVQGLSTFCAHRGAGAKAYQTSTQADVHNLHTEEGAKIVRESCLEPQVVQGEGLIAVPGFPGLTMFNAGGHTPGSTIFFVAVGNKLWVLSGDVSNNKQMLLNNQGKGFLYSYLLVPENTRQLERLRTWLTMLDQQPAIEVIVSHDAEALAQSDIAKL